MMQLLSLKRYRLSNVLAILLLVLTSTLLWADGDSVGGAHVDRTYTDDLYLPTLAGDDAVPPIALDDAFLQRATVDGEAHAAPVEDLAGRAGLRLRPAPGRNRGTLSWTEPVQPGLYYSFTAAARVTGRPPEMPRAQLAMYGFLSLTWLDANGRNIPVRDKLMSRPGGELCWTVKQVRGTAPPGAVHARLTLTAGWHQPSDDVSFWFADLRWAPQVPAPVKLQLWPRVLRSPTEPFEIRVARSGVTGLTIDGCLRVQLLDQDDCVEQEWASPILITLPWTVPVQLPQDPERSWRVRVAIEPVRPYPGSLRYEVTEPVVIANSRLDANWNGRRFIKDGRPRWIIGAYHALPEDYPKLRDAGFNTIICKSYDPAEARARFDQLRELRMYGFLSLGGAGQTRANRPRLEAVVKAVREHPALLAWDLGDEPTRKGIGPREVAEHGVWAQSLGPETPTLINCCGPYVFDRFASTVDVFSMDPYPVYTWVDLPKADAGPPDLRQVSQWLDVARPHVPSGRGMLGVVEAFTFDRNSKPPANAAEVRNMVYQVAAGGAAGVMIYSLREAGWYLPDEELFTAIREINSELAELEPWLLTMPMGTDSPLHVRTSRPDQLIHATWQAQGSFRTILINVARSPHTVHLQGPHIDDQVPAEVTLPPLAVKVLEFVI